MREIGVKNYSFTSDESLSWKEKHLVRSYSLQPQKLRTLYGTNVWMEAMEVIGIFAKILQCILNRLKVLE